MTRGKIMPLSSQPKNLMTLKLIFRFLFTLSNQFCSSPRRSIGSRRRTDRFSGYQLKEYI